MNHKKLSWKHLKYLFDEHDFPNDYFLKKIKIDSVAIYSITPFKYSLKIIDIMKEKFGNLKELTITDGCACVGGDTINFCKSFKLVNAIELCPDRFNFLKDNLKLYAFKNYQLYNSDCLKIIKMSFQDIIYLDLPWSGKTYKNKDECELKLGDKHIYEICNEIKYYTKYICLKVPNNFYFEVFKENVNLNFETYDLKKFKIIILEC